MCNQACRECEGFLEYHESNYCSECTVDQCQYCLKIVDGLGEAYAHDDDADRICETCVVKYFTRGGVQ